jgi:nonribosomal peptide synthetase DhbF
VTAPSGLEDVLPLSPMQEGLLFHALYDTSAVDVYQAQVVLELEGPVDPRLLRRCAEVLVNRHQSLRAGLRLRRNGNPMQVVYRTATLPWHEIDLRDLDPVDREARLGELLEADRAERFDLARPPLLRLTLALLSEGSARLVITNHHAMLDGWSGAVLIDELLTLYAGEGDPAELPPCAPYRDYLEWLSRQDDKAARAAWRRALDGLTRPTLVADGVPGRPQVMPDRIDIPMPDGLAAMADKAARGAGVTANTLVQGAWAMVLARLTGMDDTVFGTTVAGRPPGLPGVESMVGLFINTIPVRVRLDRSATARDNLIALQEQQAALVDHQHIRFADIKRAAGAGELFDTFVVFENYPLRGGRTSYRGLRVTGASGHDAAHYPLRLIAGLEGEASHGAQHGTQHGTGDRVLAAQLEYRPDVFRPDEARSVAGLLSRALRDLIENPGRSLSELKFFVSAPPGEALLARPGEPEQQDLALGGPDAPLTPVEEVICGLFAEVLDVPSAGPRENFFDLGGQSLSAVQLLARLRSVLGADLQVRALFEAPTPRLLAGRAERASTSRAPLTPVPRPARVPLSYAQQRMWFLWQAQGTGEGYHVPVILRLSGTLDQAALRSAINDVIGRHEPLRTIFPAEDGEPYQLVRPAAPLELQAARATDADLAAALREYARLPFDLAADGPIRGRLYELGPQEHVLALVLHHIATDGWSSAPLIRDLATAYAARRAGSPPGWAPLPVQYTDYTLWQRTLLAERGEDTLLARQAEYWKRALAGLPDRIELPADRAPGTVTGDSAGTVPLALDAVAHRRLAGLARAESATMFMTLHAGLAALLSRLGAGPDCPIGTMSAGRTDAALYDLVGFFVNPLVLRADLSGDPTFRELLGRVRDVDLAAYAHQDLPFDRLVELLNPVRSPHWNPLFQVVLILQNTGEGRYELPDLRLTLEGAGNDAARIDLSLNLRERFTEGGDADGIEGIVDYAQALFDPETAEALAGRLMRLLTEAAADPGLRLSQISLLLPGERAALLSLGTGPAPASAPRPFAELFTDQVRSSPRAAAVECGAGNLTYAELDAAASALAGTLARRGIGPEHVVALAVPRSQDLVIAVLAVSQAGAAFLPLDLSYPPERLARMLAVARPSLVIATPGSAPTIPPGPVPLLVLDQPAAAGPASARSHAPEPAQPAHVTSPAYVLFTSGSTGLPRAVVVTHAGLAAFAENQRENYGADADSRVLQLASPSFDVFVAELCLALLSGACLVIPDAAEVGENLARLLAERKITHVHMPPSVLATLPRRPLPHLRTLITGAEKCPSDLAAYWARDRRMINAYGLTETTVDATFSRCAAGSPAPPAIGCPIPGVRAYVVDHGLRLVPPGVTGDLLLGGPGVARGYLGDGPATAARFVADPFRADGGRVYRTGDLARWRAEGRLEYRGRADDQLKLRGIRIEPGEIAAALRAREEVADAAVIVHDDRLVAYVVPAGESLVPEALRAELGRRLPAQYVPATFVPLDALPLTPNGKLDHARLPDPFPAVQGDQAHDPTPPRSPREQVLCELFGEVLGRPVGPADHFFELGGHSLLAARLAERIRAVLGVTLSLGHLFAAPTPASLDEYLGGAHPVDPFGVMLPLRSSGPRPPLFCVHPLAGTSWQYASLLRALEPDYPVYALQSRGLDGRRGLPGSLEEMVADYVGQIRRVQPTGPYHLLGWSLGGNIAHALAARLERAGAQVALLALLDAYPIEPDKRGLSEAELLTVIHESFLKGGYGVPAGSPAPADAAGLRAEIVGFLGQLTSELRFFPPEQRAAILDVMVNNALVTGACDPPPFSGDLLLVVATGSRQDWATPDSWQPYVRGVIESHHIDCVHAELLGAGPATEIGRLLMDRISGETPVSDTAGQQEEDKK